MATIEFWIGITRLFEPRDRLVSARLQQVNVSKVLIPVAYERVARTQAECLLLQWDCLLKRADPKLAISDIGIR